LTYSGWFTQVASALDHAHSKGIIHRDVKPDNIVISTDDENATLVDFGIALTADDLKSLTKEGYVIGTKGYMSPEQENGENLDGRTDLYSLGITLYETLSGHLPHPGGYQSLSEKNEAIPPAIDDLIKDCLTQDRNARIQSAQDFIKRLRSAFRSDVPLSTLLTEGRLHELVAALRQISADEFSAKPRGQKLLVVNRLKDLIRSDKPELRNATADVITLLTRIARFEGEGDYGPIAAAAFEWGFEKSYGPSWHGNQDIRTALIDSSKGVKEIGHRVLAKAFMGFLAQKDLGQLPGWVMHDLRLIVMALLANPACGVEADDLAVLYDRINEASH
jgi:serine/threonine protein kinase